LILTDSTHIKANASDKRKEIVTVKVEPSEYIKKLDLLCDEEDLKVRAEAISNGKNKRGYEANTTPKTKTIAKSKTDPDSGILSRPNKPGGFHYLNHQSVDGKSGIITDVFVTPANVDDCVPCVERIKYQKERFNFRIREVGADAGYDYIEIHKEMLDLGIKTFIPIVDCAKLSRSDVFPPSKFKYDNYKNVYICPAGNNLNYVSVNKSKRAKIYGTSHKTCKNCPLKSQCMSPSMKRRVLQVPFFQQETAVQRANYKTDRYYEVQRLRRIYCEGNFALQKDNHNLRRTKKRGNKNVTEHCLLSALALNLKRMVKYLKDTFVLTFSNHKYSLILRFSAR